MAKVHEPQMDSMRMNRVRPLTNAGYNVLFIILAAMAIIPILFVFIISISSEESIRQVGYSFIPSSLSSSAYDFLWNERDTIFNALWISCLLYTSPSPRD